MDRLFDRLGELLRGLRALGGGGAGQETAYDPLDPDLRQAYEELEAYLRDGPRPRSAGEEGFAGATSGGRTPGPAPDPNLIADFRALQVPFGAGLAQVRSSYKSLMHKYHPDRFSRDPDKQRLATEVSQRLNEAYRRITAHYGSQGARNPRA